MTTQSPRFRVGLVQMRSGRVPARNVNSAVTLIREAKSAGADYVLTPEMTNILERNREGLFAALAPEEQDPSLAAFRSLARELGLYVHVGSLAIEVLPEKAVNRSFLIDPKGEIIARYDRDSHVRRRSRRGRKLPGIAQLSSRRVGGGRRRAMGPGRTDDLL